jgi:hypothetical protein
MGCLIVLTPMIWKAFARLRFKIQIRTDIKASVDVLKLTFGAWVEINHLCHPVLGKVIRTRICSWWLVPANWRNQAWWQDMTRTNGDWVNGLNKLSFFFQRRIKKCTLLKRPSQMFPLKIPKDFYFVPSQHVVSEAWLSTTKHKVPCMLTIHCRPTWSTIYMPEHYQRNSLLKKTDFSTGVSKRSRSALTLPPFLLKKIALKRLTLLDGFLHHYETMECRNSSF